jgi:transposase
MGVDRKTVRTYIAKGLEPPTYKKRASAPGVVDRFEPYLCERLAAYPSLTARRLFREIKERGFSGGYSVVRDCVRDLRPARSAGSEVRFETPPGEQAQVDLAKFEVEFVDEPGVKRIVWLFWMVLGYSRLIWARFAPPIASKAAIWQRRMLCKSWWMTIVEDRARRCSNASTLSPPRYRATSRTTIRAKTRTRPLPPGILRCRMTSLLKQLCNGVSYASY